MTETFMYKVKFKTCCATETTTLQLDEFTATDHETIKDIIRNCEAVNVRSIVSVSKIG